MLQELVKEADSEHARCYLQMLLLGIPGGVLNASCKIKRMKFQNLPFVLVLQQEAEAPDFK